MEPLAVEWGIPANEYWTMTFSEIMTQVQANKKRKDYEAKERAMFDYKQAQLFSYAMSENKMPKPETVYPILADEFTPKQAEVISGDRVYTHEEMLKEQALFRQSAEGVKRALEKKQSQ